MTQRRALPSAALGAALSLALARPAMADSRSCASIFVEADAGVLGRFPELPERIRRTFAGQVGVDACAEVKLSMNHPAITVEVTLSDGRSASRSVPEREDVMAVLSALLLVPPPEPAGEASGVKAEPSRDGAAPAEASKPRVVPKRKPKEQVPRAAWRAGVDAEPTRDARAGTERGLGIELSVVTGARIGEGQTCVGVGALSLLDISGWLLGFQGRSESYTAEPGSSRAAFSLSMLGGGRFRSGSMAIDFLTGPTAMLHDDSTLHVGPAGEVIQESSSDTAPRWFFASHLNFATGSVVRGFVGVEGDIALSETSTNDIAVRTHTLPAWTIGLALGGTVGTR
jgi:hypothetical protein